MNHLFRVIWNQVTRTWQAVAEHANGHAKSCTTNVSVALACTLGVFGLAHAELPVGGNIVSGTGSISSAGNTITVVQTSDRMAANWQSFSIGQGSTVNFVQPSSTAVALNRVLGSDVSVIQGAINANGKIFLLNPNGVLFTPTAQVNVGSIVASTLNMSTADFMAGNYKFEGGSSNAIVNQGHITAANGGTIALIAAKIINEGTLTANAGNVLMGAGSKVTLDLGGPVKLQVENDTLETLISNGGAIKAVGGNVLLTSQAAATLASSVINNTGVIEANALNTGEKGNVVLFAHGGTMNLGGTIKAEGGFVETSGKNFTVQPGAVVSAAHWLIDPVNIDIDTTLAGSIQTALGSGNVTITTDGACTGVTCSGTGTDGDITVNSAISWTSVNKLALSAYRNIIINQNITVGNTAGAGELTLHYGQGAVEAGNTADYSFASGKQISLPSGGKFTEKLGSDGLAITSHFGRGAQVMPALTVNNNDSSPQSDGVTGPFVWDITPGGNHMFVMQPTGATDVQATATAFDMSTASVTKLTGVFPTTTNFSYFYQTVSLTAGQTLSRAWNYTSTDYAPYNDGSFLSFVNTTNPTDSSLKIYGLSNPLIVLGATVEGTGNWATKSYGSTGWQTANFQAGQAGTYKLGFGVFNLGDTGLSPYLMVAKSAGTTTLNGAAFSPVAVDPKGPLGSSGITIGTGTPFTPPSSSPASNPALDQAVQLAYQQSPQNLPPGLVKQFDIKIGGTGLPPNQVALFQGQSLPVVDLSGGLAFVELAGAPPATGTGQAVASNANVAPPTGITGSDPLGFMRVFVTQGGINAPTEARTEAAAESVRRKVELSR